MDIKLEHFQLNPTTDTVYLSELPNGSVKMIIPGDCIDIKEGKVNIKKLRQHLNTFDHIFIEYDFG